MLITLLKEGSGLDKKMKDKWRDKLKEKNHIKINNKDKKLPCDNADTKKTFINSVEQIQQEELIFYLVRVKEKNI